MTLMIAISTATAATHNLLKLHRHTLATAAA
jgi:hypothetical protein